MGLKLIITGATGMVGEGVLIATLESQQVEQVLMVNRRHFEMNHPKLKELVVPDFLEIGRFAAELTGYDACLFCAGISSIGLDEEKYTRITFDTTLAFADALIKANAALTFCFVSGSHTDSSEKGKVMWARVKGKTENELMRRQFKKVYNFRPGVMLTTSGQQNGKAIYTLLAKTIRVFAPKSVITLNDLGNAMIKAVIKGYGKQILEVKDIRELSIS